MCSRLYGKVTPLAPLIFVLVLDALHCGLDAQRDRHGVAPGYSLDSAGPLQAHIASVGYADDTAIIATSMDHVYILHEFVCQVFGAHAFKVIAKKTVL